MTEHVSTWLEAYHDGELDGRRLRQVEAHLAKCALCRAELEQLQALSALLQEIPAPETRTSAERFVAQVGLRLPRRSEQTAWQRGLEWGWRLAPVGLLVAWAFMEAVFWVAGTASWALRLGLGGEAVARWLPPSGNSWLEQATGLSNASLGGVSTVLLQAFGRGGPLGWSVTLNVVLSALICLLYLSWLASWYARRRSRLHQD
jgi:predicted anti-sigma-YlaC factor YlaD